VSRRASASHHRLRIIGGAWRGRRIDFPALPELRPTPDRVRETLFNWLQGYIEGSRCLDLFAGSGALGFEAASRGAVSVVMVDHDPQVVQHLRAQAEKLGATQVEIILADARTYLASSPAPFDMVFLDPPFESAMLLDACHALEEHRALKPNARVYLEASDLIGPQLIPMDWELIKARRAGQVAYHLAMKNPRRARCQVESQF
jgi:16S rRNA (guanine966-N2)-methyltransferase